MDFITQNKRIIQILKAIKATGSISKAASELYLTQPTLSKIIRNEEIKIGITLIDRTRHPFKLTPAGQYYLTKFQTILKDYQIMSNRLRRMQNDRTETIVIGVNESLAQLVLPKLLKEFHQQYPLIQIELVERTAKEMEEALLNEKLDAYIGISPAFNQNLIQLPLYADTAILVIPADWQIPTIKHPITDISPLINQQSMIMETESSGFQRMITSYLDKFNINPKVVLRTDNISTALQLSVGGLGATIIPKSMLDSHFYRQANARFISIDSTALRFNTTVSRNKHVPETQAVHNFITLLRTIYDDHNKH